MAHARLLFLSLSMLLLLISPAQGSQFQEDGERSAQARLPQGRSALWAILRTTRIRVDDARGIFSATHPAAVRALSGKTISLAGFIMPLEQTPRGTHFLLSKYTPVCAFCPPGEPNEVVEVRSANPITFTQRLVTVTGTFSLENNGEKGLFFRMAGASVH